MACIARCTQRNRAESIVQSRIIAFGLAGFAGYSVLLLIMQVHKEWAELMPYSNSIGFLTGAKSNSYCLKGMEFYCSWSRNIHPYMVAFD